MPIDRCTPLQTLEACRTPPSSFLCHIDFQVLLVFIIAVIGNLALTWFGPWKQYNNLVLKLHYLRLLVSHRYCCDSCENLKYPETPLWIHCGTLRCLRTRFENCGTRPWQDMKPAWGRLVARELERSGKIWVYVEVKNWTQGKLVQKKWRNRVWGWKKEVWKIKFGAWMIGELPCSRWL